MDQKLKQRQSSHGNVTSFSKSNTDISVERSFAIVGPVGLGDNWRGGGVIFAPHLHFLGLGTDLKKTLKLTSVGTQDLLFPLKQEALLFPFSPSLKPPTVSLPDSITLDSHNIPFSDSARNPESFVSKNCHEEARQKICQTAYFELKRISSIRRFLTEDASKTLVTAYILSRLDYCNSLLMGTPNSIIQLSYRKFRTLLQDLFSWHPVTTTQYLSWKNCTGFPFQNVLSRLYVFQCYKWFWSCLLHWTAACLHSVLYTTLFFWHPHAGNPTIQTQDSWPSHLLLLWAPHLEFTPTRP